MAASDGKTGAPVLAQALVREAAARRKALAGLHLAAAMLQDADDARRGMPPAELDALEELVFAAIRALTEVAG